MRRLAEALEAARRTRSRLLKEDALAKALRAMADDPKSLEQGARLAAGLMLPVADPRTLGTGWRLLLDCASMITKWDDATIRACSRVTGDLGEAFGLLVGRDAKEPGITLPELATLFSSLADTRVRFQKLDLLVRTLERASGLEIKYVVKAMTDSLRTGVQAGVLESAIAKAFEVPLEDVRRAAALVSDPGIVAVLASEKRLGTATIEIGRPLAFMLATPLDAVQTPPDPARTIVEDKLDGVRAQLHKRGTTVSIFARGLDRVTGAFPEVAEAFAHATGDVVLDGEIMAVSKDGTKVRPFQALQARLNKRNPDRALMEKVPVTLFAYDILVDGTAITIDLPWTERRKRLEVYARERSPKKHFMLNEARRLASIGSLDAEFDAARSRGNEGVVLKNETALYEAGRRGQSWIKVKRAFATIDAVVVAAEEGHGRRAGTLSDYTFAVWTKNPSEEGATLVTIGKAYSGVTDAEIEMLTKRFRAETIERHGPFRVVEPRVVLEIGFDGIQRSKRHKSGYALRFPRIMRIRDDKKPNEADTMATVESLFASQLETGHREEDEEEPPKPKQLTLFE